MMRAPVEEGAAVGHPQGCAEHARRTILSIHHPCQTRGGRPQDCINLRGDVFFKMLDGVSFSSITNSARSRKKAMLMTSSFSKANGQHTSYYL